VADVSLVLCLRFCAFYARASRPGQGVRQNWRESMAALFSAQLISPESTGMNRRFLGRRLHPNFLCGGAAVQQAGSIMVRAVLRVTNRSSPSGQINGCSSKV